MSFPLFGSILFSMLLELKDTELRFLKAVGFISFFCLVLFAVRFLLSGVTRYIYIPENLALAWLALILAWVLVKRLGYSRWASGRNILLSLAWVFFLPNTWYVLTDFIHVDSRGQVSQLFDIVMMASLVVSGFLLGFASLYLVHKEFLKRLDKLYAHTLVAIILFLSSFAIYLGRNLRWNTWDIVTDPSGLILNVTDRIIDPLNYPSATNVTILFFLLLGVLYMAIWQLFGEYPKKKH